MERLPVLSRSPMIAWLLALSLLIVGWPVGSLADDRAYPANEFFTGPPLEMAEAIERNDMAALRQGGEQGVDLHARGHNQITLMWFAMLKQNVDAVRTLVELGVHPDAGRVEGGGARTPLGLALGSLDTRFLAAMLDGGLSPNEGAEDDNPLLFDAITMGTLDHVKLLVERGADLHFRTHNGTGYSPFAHSTTGTKPDIAIYLLEQGSEPNFRMNNGVTTAWIVHYKLNNLQPDDDRSQFIQLRDKMIERGVDFPPPPPVEVREQMRAEGLTPVVPTDFGYER